MTIDLNISRYYLTRPAFVPTTERHPLIKYTSPVTIRDFFIKEVEDSSIVETGMVIALDNSKHMLGYTILSKGDHRSTLIPINLCLKFAIDTVAASIIVVHNHPSGSMILSDADWKIMKSLYVAAKMIHSELLDFIIISGTTNNLISMQEKGTFNVMRRNYERNINKVIGFNTLQ